MKRAVLTGLVWACAGAARAQDTPPPGWSGDFGLAGRARPTHIGSTGFTVDALPIIELHYGPDVQLSLDDGAKWTVGHSGGWTYGPVAEYRQAYSDALAVGAHHPQDAIEIGGFAAHRPKFGEVEVRLRRAVNGYQGWSGDLSFDTGGKVGKNWEVGAEARVSWADSNYTDAYFGVRPRTAHRLGLPQFQENDFTTVGVEFGAARRLTTNTRLVASLALDRIVGPEDPTPSFRSRDIPTFTLGLTYRWPGH